MDILNSKRSAAAFRSLKESPEQDDFVMSRTGVGNQSNMKQDSTPADSDIDDQLSAFDPDAVTTGYQFELGQMNKKDRVLAKQKVLRNLSSNRDYYNNPASFINNEPENEDPELAPPSQRMGSADAPPLSQEGFDPLSAGPNPSATEGQPPDEEFYNRTNSQMQSLGLKFMAETLQKRYCNALIDLKSNGVIVLKQGNVQTALTPIDDTFYILIKEANREVLYESVNRKKLLGTLDRYFKSKRKVKVTVMGPDMVPVQKMQFI